MFTHQWMQSYPLQEQGTAHSQQKQLTTDEKNALWYVGGYVIKALNEKITSKHSAGGCNNEALLALETFKESDEIIDDDCKEIEEQNNKEWFEAINRGGLTRCTNDFYIFLTNVEITLKGILLGTSSHLINKSKVLEELKTNGKISGSWNILVKSIDTEIATFLLDMLLNFYTDFRVFAHANRTMESYKKR